MVGLDMARQQSITKSGDGIKWVDPLIGIGLPVVWDDGVHVVEKVEYSDDGLVYTLKCGVKFTFYCKHQNVLEAKLNLRAQPTCPYCLD